LNEDEAKELGRDMVSFDMDLRKTGDKKGQVREMVVSDAEVIHHQDQRDRTRDMTEESRRRHFDKNVRGEMRPYIVLSMRKIRVCQRSQIL
jgi:hypothetical protein